MKLKIEKIMAREGLLLIALALVLYFALTLCKAVPVVLPKYRAQFADGKEYTITIYPDINYKSAFDSGALLKEIHNPPPGLVSKRINEFAKQANIKSKFLSVKRANSVQLRASGAYSRVMSLPFIIKIFFVYIILLLVRFVNWALGALKA